MRDVEGNSNTPYVRKKSGGMLVIACVMLFILIFIGACGFSLNGLLLAFLNSQIQADAEAVSLAGNINFADRVGQINEMEECSRELCFVSRSESLLSEDEDFQFLGPLCRRLEDESRAGHALVEDERRNQLNLIGTNIKDAVRRYNAGQGHEMSLSLPWLHVSKPHIVRVEAGYIDGGDSNVKSLDVVDELANFDRDNHYINSATNLYRGNIRTTIPGSGDLYFNMSALPARVKSTVSPARNTNPDVFRRDATLYVDNNFGQGAASTALEQIPNALQVFYSIDVALFLGEKRKASLSLVSTATTAGAIAGAD